MMDAESVRALLAGEGSAADCGDGVRVSTHCLYPSNGMVGVVVRGGDNAFVVSDEGGALQEIGASGRSLASASHAMGRLVRPQGLRVENGSILSPPVTLSELAVAIILVANASKEVADWGLANTKFKPARNFKQALAELLKRHFHDELKHDQLIAGRSNKAHKFRHVVHLSRGRRLLIDPAVNDSTSINARVVANMDVRMAENPDLLQLIVYDDQEKWESATLALLGFGAPTVAFGKAEGEIKRFAA